MKIPWSTLQAVPCRIDQVPCKVQPLACQLLGAALSKSLGPSWSRWRLLKPTSHSTFFWAVQRLSGVAFRRYGQRAPEQVSQLLAETQRRHRSTKRQGAPEVNPTF